MKSFLALLLVLALPLSALAEMSNSEKGRDFLEENRQQSDVVVTKSGLQYKILEPGNEKRARKRSYVTVNYQGKHLDNTVFDSTFNDEPLKLKLSGVIKGWTEGLQLIGEGGRILLFIPSRMAYGRDGAPPAIGRNETLVFIVDLLEIHD
jgi:FKBP-type peptidyl-prolyl cis-trans isomerase